MSELHVSTKKKLDKTISQEQNVIAHFYTSELPVSRYMMLILKGVQNELSWNPLHNSPSLLKEDSDIALVHVNIFKKDSLNKEFGIVSVPSLVFYKDGKEAGCICTLKSMSKVMKKIKAIYG